MWQSINSTLDRVSDGGSQENVQTKDDHHFQEDSEASFRLLESKPDTWNTVTVSRSSKSAFLT
ncbi:hypothetical protein T10_9267 [Trichinella papuae]|uniref:Uncharacterized protein n=1 Tax=Trichinella papuae TaxID=268474 RepID=A0A0V1N5J7_9BILA|nr:hypothetical protein T10_9267 [Trichinella papuae]